MSISSSNLFNVSVVSSAGMPAWRANAALNTWYSIPGTAFTSYTQSPPLPFPYFGGGPKMIIEAWGGLAHSPTKKKLFAMGGGHADYAGNDMYELNFGADAPFWALIKQYTPAAQIVADARRYNDGNPCSFHSYYDLHFIDQMDEFILMGTSGHYSSGQTGTGAVERFIYSTKTWRPVGECPSVSGLSAPGPGSGKAKHPTTEEVYFLGNSFFLWKYNPVTATATSVGNPNQAVAGYYQMCVDPIRNRILRTPYAAGDGTPSGGWVTLSLTNGAPTTVNLSGDSISSPPAGSLQWDSIGTRFLHIDHSNVVTAIDPVTFVATRVSVAGTPPPAGAIGFHARSIFSAEMKGIFTVPIATDNVYFLKLYA